MRAGILALPIRIGTLGGTDRRGHQKMPRPVHETFRSGSPMFMELNGWFSVVALNAGER